MKVPHRVAFVGNYSPRRCGIATFTHDLHRAVAEVRPEMQAGVVAMNDCGRTYAYPPAVNFEIREDEIEDYVRAAKFLNSGGFDVVSLQHEYGIFGGEAGSNILELLSRLKLPVVTTLHTVLPNPSPSQYSVMRQIIDASARLVVMSQKGADFLQSVHDVPAHKIDIIPHGIPDFPFIEPQIAKSKFGFGNKAVVLTFGLLSPGKGIETVIDAMPGILKCRPDAVYVVLGATHPHLVQQEGETYRDSLTARARALGIEDQVVFIDQFVDQSTLLDYISMCDVYVTPYLNEAQMTSGTLAYSFGLGKAVVSTPYWHAQELLADGAGILVPFNGVAEMCVEISGLLTNDGRRRAMGQRAYAASRSMIWPQTAAQYLTTFSKAFDDVTLPILLPNELTSSTQTQNQSIPVLSQPIPDLSQPLPNLRMEHFLSLCDDVGMLQHSMFSVADRSHGYCVDDNARALLLSSALAKSSASNLPEVLTARLAAFVQHAWNPDVRRFRNFMSYDRRWLEDVGSEDSHGRTLWALGDCSLRDSDASRRRWAAILFKSALLVVDDFSHTRAWAFTLLGLDAYCATQSADFGAKRMREVLADRLISKLSKTETTDWIWFEDFLSYDNARLPQALIQTGVAMRKPSYVDAGLRTLRWLMKMQTSPSGYFRPVGTTSFGKQRIQPDAFDQQPVEALATISACLAAQRIDAGAGWAAGAFNAFDWFYGRNDLQINLIDPITGGCSDGLHPHRANENRGAESALSYLLAHVEIHEYKRSIFIDRSTDSAMPARRVEQRTTAPRMTSGGALVSIPIPKTAKPIPAARSSQSRR